MVLCVCVCAFPFFGAFEFLRVKNVCRNHLGLYRYAKFEHFWTYKMICTFSLGGKANGTKHKKKRIQVAIAIAYVCLRSIGGLDGECARSIWYEYGMKTHNSIHKFVMSFYFCAAVKWLFVFERSFL